MSVSSRYRFALVPMLALLSACASLQPEPLSTSEIQATSAADRLIAHKDVEPLQGPLTLEEAIARAIKYNLERRVRRMEESVAMGQFETGNYDMLPKLVASAGYRDRNNDLVSRSKDSVTGQPSLANPYISSDRAASTADLSFTWSLLDFGQSYYASKQNADRVLIAAERRRKALHLLIQDVRTAFWRATAAQKLRADIQATILAAEEAMLDAKKMENERLRNPVDALRYQRQLLENLRLLEAIDQELSTARIELSTLTNLPLGLAMTVVEPHHTGQSDWQTLPIEKMEELAITNNADLRESFYNARIAREETQRTLLRMFPGLSFSYSTKSSSDSYLVHQNWNEAGAQISFNLLGIFSAPAQRRLAQAGVAVADQRRIATQMAVLAQVHLARLNYSNALRQFERAQAIWQADQAIADHTSHREQAQAVSKLDRVATQTAALLSSLRRYQALAQAHGAASKLQASLGLEPAMDQRDDIPLEELKAAVAKSLDLGDAAPMKATSVDAPSRGPLAPAVPLPPNKAQAHPIDAPTPPAPKLSLVRSDVMPAPQAGFRSRIRAERAFTPLSAVLTQGLDDPVIAHFDQSHPSHRAFSHPPLWRTPKKGTVHLLTFNPRPSAV